MTPSRRTRWFRRSLLFLCVAPIALYAIVVAAFFFAQRWLIFIPAHEVERTPAAYGATFEELWLESGRDPGTGHAQRINGWWLPAAPDSPAILLLHGNGRTIGDMAEHGARLVQLGYAVLVIDYRGYGRSDGDAPSEATLYADAQAAWQRLRELAPDPRKRYVYGHSLGGAVAIEVAVRNADVAGVIVESSFASLADLMRWAPVMRLLPLDWLLRERFDSAAKLPALGKPILLLHGEADEFVPAYMSDRLYAAARPPKTLVKIPGANHSDIAAVAPQRYAAALREFVTR